MAVFTNLLEHFLVVSGKMYVVGGSDGQYALSSVEVLDMDTLTWAPGPPLSIPRANLCVSVYEDRLFAVGGFSGKKFLDTMEFLEVGSEEWSRFLPANAAAASQAYKVAVGNGVAVGPESGVELNGKSHEKPVNGVGAAGEGDIIKDMDASQLYSNGYSSAVEHFSQEYFFNQNQSLKTTGNKVANGGCGENGVLS